MTDPIPQQLYLVFSDTKPNINNYDVKSANKVEFLNEDFMFNVIGSSHLIFNQQETFCELISCEQPHPHETDLTIPLSKSTDIKTEYKIKDITASITIKGEPLSEAPAPESQQIAYKFDEKAYTMINITSPTAYETYHMYPEFDLSLFSQTTIIEQ